MPKINVPLRVKEYLQLHRITAEGGYEDVKSNLAQTAEGILQAQPAAEEDLSTFTHDYNLQFPNRDPNKQLSAKKDRGNIIGAALEVLMFAEIKAKLAALSDAGRIKSYHAVCNVELKHADSDQTLGEMDVACVIDTRLLQIECKSFNIGKGFYSTLAQISDIQAYGRLETDHYRPILASQSRAPLHLDDNQWNAAKDLGVEIWPRKVLFAKNAVNIGNILGLSLSRWGWI